MANGPPGAHSKIPGCNPQVGYVAIGQVCSADGFESFSHSATLMLLSFRRVTDSSLPPEVLPADQC